MINTLLGKVFGTKNEREIKRLMPRVAAINALEPEIQNLSDDQLRAKTAEFRARIQERLSSIPDEPEVDAGGPSGALPESGFADLDRLKEIEDRRSAALKEVLDELLEEAFAVCREAGRRVLNMRHFDVQLIGGMVLHEGKIAEMKTGEGKTLVGTLPVYLNALSGRGVHVVTVNDYLAKRDSEWMGKLYGFLGLTVGVIVHDLDDSERRAAYAADVTYGTNNEFGFDYLRDNMKFDLRDCVQRVHNFAIVDEVDSILIDEARTPLIISGASEESTDKYYKVNRIIPKLEKGEEIDTAPGEPKIMTGDYVVDEKHRNVTVSDDGWEKVEKLLGIGNIADPENWALKHHVETAVKAHALYKKDVEYVVKDGEVLIVDEFTGRLMPGRRWSDGLHQAIEAKENVKIERENQTLATITFQNYFRMYPKLAGMTGTAITEAGEFSEIYKLDVVEMPTNQPVSRVDGDDEVYRTADEKNAAITMLIEEARTRQQPVLVGTVSIEKSEHLAELLKKKRVPHAVLNARYHEQEAAIIAEAGRPGAVTIATNMAGRGTDIQLGGNLEVRIRQETIGLEGEAREAKIAQIKADLDAARELVKQAGGLYVVGTERHESRRIDNQLRGRSGRQGDPGNSKFFLSLEDDLMRIYGMQRMDGVLQRLGIQEGEAIIHPWINKALERAQKKVEQQHFEVRKNLLKYDDVMNDQRKVIYEQRREVMSAEIVDVIVADMRHDVIERFVARNIPPNSYAEQWNVTGLKTEIQDLIGIDIPIEDWAAEQGISDETVLERIICASDEKVAGKIATYGADIMNQVERSLLLQILDQSWKEHLLALDHLRQGINLRAYGQRDPLNEYKREAFQLFAAMLDDVREQITRYLANIEFRTAPAEDVPPPPAQIEMHETRVDPALEMAPGFVQSVPSPYATSQQPSAGPAVADVNDQFGKVQRNAPCPCGSGKKFKHCHGNL